MMSSKNKGFTACDIERYHSGKMSPQERHALEKAALDDPFLADALEGYAFTSTPSSDLSKIQSRLDEKLSTKKAIPFFQKYKWLSAAAIFIIVAAGGWIAYTISDRSKETSVAVQKNARSKAEQQQSIPAPGLLTDSIKSQATTSTADKPIETSKFTDSKQNDASATNPPITQTNEVAANRPIEIAMERNRQQAKSKAKTLPAPLNELNINNTFAAGRKDISQINRDTLLLDAGYASGITPQKNILEDSVSYVTAAPIRVRGTAPADSVTNINIVLKPLPMDSAQIVVIGYGTRKAKERYPKVTIDTLEPAEGYVNFDDYVATNLKVPEELRTKTVSGEVQLSFDVDKNGLPTNIAVVKSLCQKCDEEAIRLLKEGPKWKKKKNQKGKITIKF